MLVLKNTYIKIANTNNAYIIDFYIRKTFNKDVYSSNIYIKNACIKINY